MKQFLISWRRVQDANLRHTLQFGIGLHHAGLVEGDRELGERLFVGGQIQVGLEHPSPFTLQQAWHGPQCALLQRQGRAKRRGCPCYLKCNHFWGLYMVCGGMLRSGKLGS